MKEVCSYTIPLPMVLRSLMGSMEPSLSMLLKPELKMARKDVSSPLILPASAPERLVMDLSSSPNLLLISL